VIIYASAFDHDDPTEIVAGMNFPRDLIRTIGRFKTTSVLAPLLVGGIIIGGLALALTMWIGPNHPLSWMLWIFVVVYWTLAIGGGYAYWSFKEPDRLQTENYQLQQQRIRVVTDERHPGKTIEHEPLTPNTALQSMGAGNER
jgi:hypothetical protein